MCQRVEDKIEIGSVSKIAKIETHRFQNTGNL
jgi:hypothetical protein